MATRLLIAAGVTAIVASVFVLAFIAADEDESTINLSSDSMLPTIPFDARVSVDEGAYEDSGPKRGDVVAFNPPVGALTNRCGAKFKLNSGCDAPTEIAEGQADGQEFVMRVIASEGDEISIERGRAIVNGSPVDEPYVNPCKGESGCELPAPVTVPEGHLYVLGDNRLAAKDSRYWGPLPADAVLGRADVE